ncbi:hypothetical protein CUMW_014030 [Citrus unshiu]|nr:hypothetical protein CUMW_014030 [Citrus unshiu]
MSSLILNCSSCTSSSSARFSPHKHSEQKAPIIQSNTNWAQKAVINVLTGALSFNLLLSSPLALESSSSVQSVPPSPSPSPSLTCHEGEDAAESEPRQVVAKTNEGIVEEAWQIVNDSFLDTGRHRWTPQNWQRKREDILSSSIQTRSKAHGIIKRMLASLGDPYTRFLSPAEFSKMARYDMSGIGINLREVPDANGVVRLKVLGLILDGPAHSAGVRQGDEVRAVNGVDVRGKSAFEVSSLLQGPSETFVTIECLDIVSLDCMPLLSIFMLVLLLNKEITIMAAMKRLQDMGASYFILDLRDNLGGLVQAGIEIAKLFLNEGETITYTVGRDPQYQKTIVADNIPLVTAPVIVLVNNRTASASEIVASALHDNCRAVLVGEKTFGKGLIQSVYELHDGSGVVVTIGKYVTPNHMDINGNGIEPDYRNLPG